MVFKMEKIAVIIPVYNGIGVVDQCIKALTTQSVKPDNIICIDDASPDNSYKYIKKRYQYVTVIRSRCNLGASGAYALGIYYAYINGYKWIWLLDQDSEPQKNTLEKLLHISKKYYMKKIILTPTLVSKFLNYVYIMINRKRFLFIKRDFDPNKPYHTLLASFSGLLLPYVAIKEAGLPSIELTMDCADWEYSIRLWLYGWNIFVMPKGIVYHKGGKPTISPSIYRRSFYKYIYSKIVYQKSKIQIVSIYSKSRYYTRGKNSIYLFRLPYTPNIIRAYILYWLTGMFIKLLFAEEDGLSKTKSYLTGISQGLLYKPGIKTAENARLKSFIDAEYFLNKSMIYE